MPKNTLNRRQLMAGSATLTAAALTSPVNATQTAPDLSGKTVLITGCSSGFGRLSAEYFATLGARVFATMRNLPRQEAIDLKNLAKTQNLPIEVIEIDVLSDEQVESGVAKVLEHTGGTLDILINNAGIGITGPVELQDIEATRLAFDTNVFGCQRMIRAVLPTMRAAKKGQIFSISSQLGRLIVPSAGHYSATKFALEALNEQLAYELVPHGIDVTIIQPGAYPTKIWVNRNQYTSDLKERTSQGLQAAYPQLVAAMGKEDGTSRKTDPLDVPRAMVEIINMPTGKRPLRRAVHPTYRPQEAANNALAKAQLEFLGETQFGPWIKDVLD